MIIKQAIWMFQLIQLIFSNHHFIMRTGSRQTLSTIPGLRRPRHHPRRMKKPFCLSSAGSVTKHRLAMMCRRPSVGMSSADHASQTRSWRGPNALFVLPQHFCIASSSSISDLNFFSSSYCYAARPSSFTSDSVYYESSPAGQRANPPLN